MAHKGTAWGKISTLEKLNKRNLRRVDEEVRRLNQVASLSYAQMTPVGQGIPPHIHPSLQVTGCLDTTKQMSTICLRLSQTRLFQLRRRRHRGNLNETRLERLWIVLHAIAALLKQLELVTLRVGILISSCGHA